MRETRARRGGDGTDSSHLDQSPLHDLNPFQLECAPSTRCLTILTSHSTSPRPVSLSPLNPHEPRDIVALYGLIERFKDPIHSWELRCLFFKGVRGSVSLLGFRYMFGECSGLPDRQPSCPESFNNVVSKLECLPVSLFLCLCPSSIA